MVQSYYSLSDEDVSLELGKRLERLRLDSPKQFTQSRLAQQAGISRSTYQKLIEGKGTLVNLISVLRALEELENLDALLPSKPISPVQLLKLQGKVRQRVSSTKSAHNASETEAQPDKGEPLDW